MYNQSQVFEKKPKKKEIWANNEKINEQWPRVAVNDSQKLL